MFSDLLLYFEKNHLNFIVTIPRGMHVNIRGVVCGQSSQICTLHYAYVLFTKVRICV